MNATPQRDRTAAETRDRIAAAALTLFVSQGYAETTIDQISSVAKVSRRTVFHHYPNKSAILFEQLVGRRKRMLQRLRERPETEPAVMSLYCVLREMCDLEYEGALLTQVRAVIEAEPGLAAELRGSPDQELAALAILEARSNSGESSTDIKAAVAMGFGWMTAAAHVYVIDHRQSLVECFDEVVASCLKWSVADLTG